jgi:protein phosphatase
MQFIRRRAPTGRGAESWATSAERVIDCGFATALGDRLDNQDRCAVSERWLVLSDGAGGHAGGALAAEVTVEAVLACLNSAPQPVGILLVEEATRRANQAVRSRRRSNPAVAGMAATLTVAVATSVVDGESEWLVSNIGDSRAWVVTPEGSTQVTEDDNVAAQLVKAGAITPAEALEHPGRHWITRAIGPEDGVAPQVRLVRLRRNDVLLLSSDGLDVLSPEVIHEVILATTSSKDAAEQLVDRALSTGATDNVTAAVARHLPSACHGLEDESAS